MSTFDTPEPISVTLDLTMGSARIIASDRDTTVVTIQPSDPNSKNDVRAAEQTQVDYSSGRLLIKTPRSRGISSYFGKGDSVNVTVEVPAKSSLRIDTQLGDIRSDGELSECRVRSSGGDVFLDQVGSLDVSNALGNVTVNRAVGQVNITVQLGEVHLAELDGTGTIKSSTGNCSVGNVTGELRIKAAYGDISVTHADASIDATTAYGSVRIDDISRGSLAMETSFGDLEVGISKGSAAWLDVNSQQGQVRNMLTATENPAQSDNTVEVRGRTSYGDIIVRRS